MYLEPVGPVFLGFNRPKDGPLQSKQGSFGFQVCIYIYNSPLPPKKNTPHYFWWGGGGLLLSLEKARIHLIVPIASVDLPRC